MFQLILLLLPFLALQAFSKAPAPVESILCEETPPAKQTICLNMIVKDESRVIRRCLDNVKDLIDYWVIVDTGSTDGTQEIIREHMADIPGELHEIPWKNWGETRSAAFKVARGKGDYILFMDADDTLEFDGERTFPELSADMYNMRRGVKGFTYLKPQIVKGDLPWKWVGVTHEYLTCDQYASSAFLENVRYVSGDGGARSFDPQKIWKNVYLLEAGLKEEPDNNRYAFYLAESYRDVGEKGKSVETYQKMIKMGGWAEEIFWSKFQIAKLLQEIGLPDKVIIESYKDAIQCRPHRCEPYYYLAETYNHRREYKKAYDLIKAWEKVPKPDEKDYLFCMDWIEEYGLDFELGICSHYLGHYQEAVDACDRVIAIADIPENWRQQAMNNRKFPLEQLELAMNE